jgi:hypothetical protein
LARFIGIDASPSRTIDFSGISMWLLAIALLAAGCLLARYGADSKTLAQNSFASYYCAGGLAREHQDPYSTASPPSCEHDGLLVAPATLPGYDIAPFTLASFVPYHVALGLWEALLFMAIVATLWTLRKLTGLPQLAIAAVLIPTECGGSLLLGELAPFAVLGVALTGLFLTRDAPRGAAYSAALTLALPQVGLPVVVALFFFAPRTRWLLWLVLALLGAIALAQLGPAANLEYLRQALSARVESDLTLPTQSWLAWALTIFNENGVVDALRYGWLQSTATALLAVLFAPRIARALDAPAALVAFPAAAAVLGGASIQSYELAVAIPFAMLLASRPTRFALAGWLGLALLAIPNVWHVRTAPEQTALGAVALAILVVSALHERPWFGRFALPNVVVSAFRERPWFGRFALPNVVVSAFRERPWFGRFALPQVVVSAFREEPWLGRFALALGAVAILIGATFLVGEFTPPRQVWLERAPGWLALLLVFAAGLAAPPVPDRVR